MAIRVINPDATRNYVSPSDQEPATVWKLGTLDSRIMGFIEDSVTKLEISAGRKGSDQAEPVFRTGTRRWLLVKYGLRGWTNLLDANGQPVAETFDAAPHFGRSYAVVPDRVLELIPADILSELASELGKQNRLQEDEKPPFGS